jgi:hypothetical protein
MYVLYFPTVRYENLESRVVLCYCLSEFSFRRKAWTFSHTSKKEMVIKESDRKYEYFKHVNFIVLVCKFIVQFNF